VNVASDRVGLWRLEHIIRIFLGSDQHLRIILTEGENGRAYRNVRPTA